MQHQVKQGDEIIVYLKKPIAGSNDQCQCTVWYIGKGFVRVLIHAISNGKSIISLPTRYREGKENRVNIRFDQKIIEGYNNSTIEYNKVVLATEDEPEVVL